MGKRGPEKSKKRQVAEEAGMSRHQMYQAEAIASIPDEEFEELVESDELITITEMAKIGRRYKRKQKGPSNAGRPKKIKRCPHCGKSIN